MSRRAATPWVLVVPVLAAVVLWLGSGVGVLEVLAFLAYQAAFIAAPGVLVVVALLGRGTPWLTRLAVGWPAGYALELAAFAGTAAVGARWALWLYPVIVAGGCVWAIGRADGESDGRPGRASPVPAGPVWASAGVVVGALVLVGLGAFATYPLPASVPETGVVLYDDLVFGISLAGDALHHWPITNPNVSGAPLRYHVFAFLDSAATAQITGISLDVVVLRLQPVVFLGLIGLQVAWLAVNAIRRWTWAAPLAVAIVMFASELDVDLVRDAPFAGLFFTDLALSPTFALGLVFFIPVVGLMLGALRAERPVGIGTWVLITALLAGAMGAKATTVPVVGGALVLFLVWRRRPQRAALVSLGLTALAFGSVYVLLFSGGGDAGAVIDPFAYVDSMLLGSTFDGPVRTAIAGLAGTIALLAPWLGALLLIGRTGPSDRVAAIWLACTALAATGAFLLLSQPGFSQVYFFHCAAPGAAVLSAWGITRAWLARDTVLGSRPAVVPAIALVAAIGMALLLRGRLPVDATVTGVGYLVPFALLGGVVAVAAVVVGRAPGRALALGVSVVVMLTLLDVPTDTVAAWVDKRATDQPLYQADQPTGPNGLNGEMVAGLTWLRSHSDPDDVIAVNLDVASGEPGRFFGFSAYAERRTFLGGFAYTSEAVAHKAQERPGLPFARRRALNTAAFAGNGPALATLRDRYGVRYLVADVRHGRPAPALDVRLRRVYSNGALRIYRLG